MISKLKILKSTIEIIDLPNTSQTTSMLGQEVQVMIESYKNDEAYSKGALHNEELLYQIEGVGGKYGDMKERDEEENDEEESSEEDNDGNESSFNLKTLNLNELKKT